MCSQLRLTRRLDNPDCGVDGDHSTFYHLPMHEETRAIGKLQLST
jgi:hypothetical protein